MVLAEHQLTKSPCSFNRTIRCCVCSGCAGTERFSLPAVKIEHRDLPEIRGGYRATVRCCENRDDRTIEPGEDIPARGILAGPLRPHMTVDTAHGKHAAGSQETDAGRPVSITFGSRGRRHNLFVVPEPPDVLAYLTHHRRPSIASEFKRADRHGKSRRRLGSRACGRDYVSMRRGDVTVAIRKESKNNEPSRRMNGPYSPRISMVP